MKTLDIKEAGELLNMHSLTVRKMAKAGQIPAARAGRNWIFIEEDLIEWLRSQYSVDKKESNQAG